jgi:hypothetical protein
VYLETSSWDRNERSRESCVNFRRTGCETRGVTSCSA